MARPIHPVVVGTAGHIDHGKSSLVRALTGIDPDRLKEEKERGLTIDLGFARLKMRDGRWLGLVDVPGHERFVRNMVAGSTGIDIAVLVVAADDGVMPQTIEHLDILDVLGVRTGAIALNKIDLVDEEIAAVAEEEVRELVKGTVLADAPVCHLSSVTGAGIEEFRDLLEQLAQGIEPRSHGGSFRMPIQRVFTLKGIGTVITGIPLAGSLRPGDEVEVLPIAQRVKVRALHAYGGKVEEAVAGHSTALSVPDARDLGVRRGMVAASPGVFSVGDAVDIELRVLPRARALSHRERVRFHTGTSEVRGTLLLLDRDQLGGGETATARILLDTDVSCFHGDRFLMRLQNPVVTVGGGAVLRITKAPARYRRQALGDELVAIQEAGERPEARLLHEVTQAGPQGCAVEPVAGEIGLQVDEVRQVLEDLHEVHVHDRSDRAFLSEIVQAGTNEVMESVERMLHKRAQSASIVQSALRTSRTLPRPLIDAVIDLLCESGRVRRGSQGRLLFLDRLKPLAPVDQDLLDRVVAHCTESAFRAPTAVELAEVIGVDQERLAGILDRGRDESLLEPVGSHYYAGSVVRGALKAIHTNCGRHDGVLDIPELRDELATSRKFLIPLLEHVDSLGLTVLRGGVRRLLSTSDLARELAGGG